MSNYDNEEKLTGGNVSNVYRSENTVRRELKPDSAKMLRLYHDAVSDFPLLDDWKPMDHTPNNIEVLCHNDFAIYNIIFNNEKPVGIIDFDVAAPGQDYGISLIHFILVCL